MLLCGPALAQEGTVAHCLPPRPSGDEVAMFSEDPHETACSLLGLALDDEGQHIALVDWHIVTAVLPGA